MLEHVVMRCERCGIPAEEHGNGVKMTCSCWDPPPAPEPEPERTGNDLGTPPLVWRVVQQLGSIELDPCSNRWSSVPARVRLDGSSAELDGLQADWKWIALEELASLAPRPDGLVFVNPPYGRGELRRWVEKVLEEASRGVEIVLLVPASIDTKWWGAANGTATARCLWKGRIPFEGGKHGTGSFASALLYYGPRPWLFCHLLDPHGEVTVLR